MDGKLSGISSHEVDETAQTYMLETAKWAKFLSILGFLFCSLLIIGAIFFTENLSRISGINETAVMSSTKGFIYIIIAGVCVYPIYAQYQFAKLIETSIKTLNQEKFNAAFRQLDNMYQYTGIIIIICLVVYSIIMIFALVGAVLR